MQIEREKRKLSNQVLKNIEMRIKNKKQEILIKKIY